MVDSCDCNILAAIRSYTTAVIFIGQVMVDSCDCNILAAIKVIQLQSFSLDKYKLTMIQQALKPFVLSVS